jgi:hypothetical protein
MTESVLDKNLFKPVSEEENKSLDAMLGIIRGALVYKKTIVLGGEYRGVPYQGIPLFHAENIQAELDRVLGPGRP